MQKLRIVYCLQMLPILYQIISLVKTYLFIYFYYYLYNLFYYYFPTKRTPQISLFVDLVVSLALYACVYTYTCVFVSSRCMESVRYLPTLTLKSNFETTLVYFVKVDQWSCLDSSGIFFFFFIHLIHFI